jgi:putative transposase
MGMMDCSRLSLLSSLQLPDNAVWCINSRVLLNALPHRERKEVSIELAGIFKQEKQEDALLNLAAFKATYQKRYPEAIRRLCADEEHLLTFYAFPQVMHRSMRTTNAMESFGSQRATTHGPD